MRFFHSILPFALLAASAASSACSSDAGSATSAPPWSNTNNGISVTRNGVNEPRPDGTSCWSSRYTFFPTTELPDTGELRIETCLDQNVMVRDVLIHGADVGPIVTLLGALRDVASPTTECNPNAASYAAEVFDRGVATTPSLADASNGCRTAGARTVDGLDRLFAAMSSIEPLIQPVWTSHDSHMVLSRGACNGEVFDFDAANAFLSRGWCEGHSLQWSDRIALSDADVARLSAELATLRWVTPSTHGDCAENLVLLTVGEDPSREYTDQTIDCLNGDAHPVEAAGIQQLFARLHDRFIDVVPTKPVR